jgi:flavin-dependent dehydrogenase
MSITPLTQCDVVILGGGPAGVATALSLLKYNPALRVVIVERSGYDYARIGETLPPNARLLLEQLNIWPAFTQAGHLPAYGTCAVWGSSTMHTNESFFNLHGHGWHLNRASFDAMLAQAAVQRGAMLYLRTRFLGCHQLSDGSWHLTVRTQKSAPTQLNPRFVVDATGRLAWLARQQDAKRLIYDQLMGVAVLFQVDDDYADTYALVETSPSGWWYSALLSGRRMMVVYMSDADLVRRQQLKLPSSWLAHVRQTEHTWTRVQKAHPLGRPAAYAAHTQRMQPVAGENWLAVGDAASTFDPLSSQGIYKALHSGIFASYAILDWFKGQTDALQRYAALNDREFRQYLSVRANYYALEQRWPNSRFWKRRHEFEPEEPDFHTHADVA